MIVVTLTCVVVSIAVCPGRKPSCLAVKRPARPYKRAVQTHLRWKTRRALNNKSRPGRVLARTATKRLAPSVRARSSAS